MPKPIPSLAWDDNNEEHLWQSHQVRADEVEEALFGDDGEPPEILRGRDGEYHFFLGKTGAGRLLVMVGEFLDDGRLYVFSARDMSDAEKRTYRKR